VPVRPAAAAASGAARVAGRTSAARRSPCRPCGSERAPAGRDGGRQDGGGGATSGVGARGRRDRPASPTARACAAGIFEFPALQGDFRNDASNGNLPAFTSDKSTLS
jgi:hypothetical protein